MISYGALDGILPVITGALSLGAPMAQSHKLQKEQLQQSKTHHNEALLKEIELHNEQLEVETKFHRESVELEKTQHYEELQEAQRIHCESLKHAENMQYKDLSFAEKLHSHGINVSKDQHNEQIKQSAAFHEHNRHLHFDTVNRSAKLHNKSLKFSRYLSMAELQHDFQLHKEAMELEKELHLESCAIEREFARREEMRDMLQQRTLKVNTLMIVDTLMFGCTFTLFVEGMQLLPDQTDNLPSAALEAFCVFFSISICSLFFSVWFAMALQSRMSKYNIARRELIYRPCGLRHATFEGFYACHCKQLSSLAKECFYIGTLFVLVSLGIIAYVKVGWNLGLTFGAIAIVVCLSITIFMLILSRALFPAPSPRDSNEESGTLIYQHNSINNNNNDNINNGNNLSTGATPPVSPLVSPDPLLSIPNSYLSDYQQNQLLNFNSNNNNNVSNVHHVLSSPPLTMKTSTRRTPLGMTLLNQTFLPSRSQPKIKTMPPLPVGEDHYRTDSSSQFIYLPSRKLHARASNFMDENPLLLTVLPADANKNLAETLLGQEKNEYEASMASCSEDDEAPDDQTFFRSPQRKHEANRVAPPLYAPGLLSPTSIQSIRGKLIASDKPVSKANNDIEYGMDDMSVIEHFSQTANKGDALKNPNNNNQTIKDTVQILHPLRMMQGKVSTFHSTSPPSENHHLNRKRAEILPNEPVIRTRLNEFPLIINNLASNSPIEMAEERQELYSNNQLSLHDIPVASGAIHQHHSSVERFLFRPSSTEATTASPQELNIKHLISGDIAESNSQSGRLNRSEMYSSAQSSPNANNNFESIHQNENNTFYNEKEQRDMDSKGFSKNITFKVDKNLDNSVISAPINNSSLPIVDACEYYKEHPRRRALFSDQNHGNALNDSILLRVDEISKKKLYHDDSNSISQSIPSSITPSSSIQLCKQEFQLANKSLSGTQTATFKPMSEIDASDRSLSIFECKFSEANSCKGRVGGELFSEQENDCVGVAEQHYPVIVARNLLRMDDTQNTTALPSSQTSFVGNSRKRLVNSCISNSSIETRRLEAGGADGVSEEDEFESLVDEEEHYHLVDGNNKKIELEEEMGFRNELRINYNNGFDEDEEEEAEHQFASSCSDIRKIIQESRIQRLSAIRLKRWSNRRRLRQQSQSKVLSNLSSLSWSDQSW